MKYPEPFKRNIQYDPSLMTAIHESGHIVTYLHFGIVSKLATIIPGHENNGMVSRMYEAVNPQGDPADVWPSVLFGGIISAALFSGRYHYQAASSDLLTIDGICDDPLRVWLMVHQIISDNERKIHDLANDLQQYKALPFEYLQLML